MKRLLLLLTLPMALTFLPAAAGAADSLLVLKGHVSNENALPVARAQVRLLDSNVQPIFAVSDDAGDFSIPNLSSGDYFVRIEKQGYFVLVDQKIHLAPGQTDFVFELNRQDEVREKVEVTVPNGQIEPNTTASTEQLSANEIRDIPVVSTHDLQESLVAMPQVVRDNSFLIHLAGARDTQALYLIDGFEVGDPASNGLDTRMVVDAVRSVELQTSRFGAEYAHPGAAVLSYETKEGDDHWHFDYTDFIPGISVQQGIQLGNYYPRAVVSGPIIKNRLWFSESVDFIHNLSVIKGLPSHQDEVTETGGDSWSRLLWKITSNNSLRASFLANLQYDNHLGLDPLHPISTSTNETEDEYFGTVKEQSYIHHTLVEFGGGAERTDGGIFPQGTAPELMDVNIEEGDFFQRLNQQSHRYQAFSNLISMPFRRLGSHTLSAGANLSSVDFSQTAARTEIQDFRADSTLARLSTFAGAPYLRVTNTLAGGYVQDAWSPNPRVIAEVGVRTDWDRMFQAALVEPRVAVNFLPLEDNRLKFSAGWGRYDIPLNLSVISQVYDQREVDTLYDATGTVPIQEPITSQFVLPPGGLTGLQQPYFNISSLGYQQKVGTSTLLSVEVLARDQEHGLAFATLSPNELGSDYELQSTRHDRYRGVTFSARHTFANHAELFGSYTRSQSTSDQVLDPALGSLYFAPQQYGPLAWDAPNRIVSWGSIPTPVWGVLFSYLLDFRSGYPYSALNPQQFLVGPADSLRFPDFISLTVGFEKKFTLRNRVYAGRISVINVMDRANPTTVVNDVDAPNFRTFAGGQEIAITGRIRFVGRK